MNQEQIWQDLSALPPNAQQMAADFIRFLRTQYPEPDEPILANGTPLAKDSFVGMWQDRVDMADSSTWVKNLRENEWTSGDD